MHTVTVESEGWHDTIYFVKLLTSVSSPQLEIRILWIRIVRCLCDETRRFCEDEWM